MTDLDLDDDYTLTDQEKIISKQIEVIIVYEFRNLIRICKNNKKNKRNNKVKMTTTTMMMKKQILEEDNNLRDINYLESICQNYQIQHKQ